MIVDKINLFSKEIIFLRTDIPWFGNHTGYEQLTKFVQSIIKIKVFAPKLGFIPRIKGKLISLWRNYGVAPQANVEALWNFEQALKKNPEAIGHILYGEDFLRFVPKISKLLLDRIVFTFHQPPNQWNQASLELLQYVKHAIFLYQKDEDFFANYLNSRPKALLHGVECDFFVPVAEKISEIRILYSGVHLRNLKMLRDVVLELQRLYPDLKFDFLVPVHHRARPEFQNLTDLKNITWHAGLSDKGLLELYQHSYLLLLPMNDSGANTAVVESLSSGLPIVTTDVGGIRDYGGASVFPIIKNDDVDGMVQLVQKYIEDRKFRNQISSESRHFAKEYLNWTRVAIQHSEYYQSLE